VATHIACIVEGHGDREAVPIVIRRIATVHDPTLAVTIPPPLRIPKSKLVKDGELERAVELAARKVGPEGAVLVIIDSDDDCPAIAGPALLRRAVAARGNMPLAVVLAKREFESWFIAAAESLAGRNGLSDSLATPEAPENIGGAKEWLSDHMAGEHNYAETIDQPALAAQFDLTVARRADSFDKFYRDVIRLLTHLTHGLARDDVN